VNFNQADKQVYVALHRLSAPEMQALLAFFNKQAEHAKSQLVHAEGVMLHRLQGRAGYLEELLEAVKQAVPVLEKMR